VTVSAVAAEPAAVCVISAVASLTSRRSANRIAAGLQMAGGAAQTRMFPIERERGLARMVEAPAPPVVGVVAALTVGAQLLLVDVVGGVTLRAVYGRALEPPIRVAGFAGRGCVEAEQREARQFVVEHDVPRETLLVMAFRAIPSEPAAVYVVCSMASGALRLELLGLG